MAITTVKKQLELILPAEVAQLAIKYVGSSKYLGRPSFLKERCRTPQEGLNYFGWGHTPEGNKWWNAVYNDAINPDRKMPRKQHKS